MTHPEEENLQMKPPSIRKDNAEVSVDLHRFAADIIGPEAYAPPDQRPDPLLDHVLRFGDLPTKELDDIIEAAEKEIEALKFDAQAIRDLYVRHTHRVVEDVKRLQGEVKIAMNIMRELRAQCTTLNANAETPNQVKE